MPAQVRVRGLTELRRALRKTGNKQFRDALTNANVAIANKVLEAARAGIAAQSETVAGSGKAVRSEAGAKLRFSSVRAGGTLYGAEHDKDRVGPSGRRFKGHNQFRPLHMEGYHVEPAVDANLEAIATAYADNIDHYLDEQGVLKAP